MQQESSLLEKTPTPIGYSPFWDVYMPLGMSFIPAGCFKLIRLAGAGADQPGFKLATWQVIALIGLETAGIIAMAVVILLRLEMGMAQLFRLTKDRPSRSRQWCLLASVGALALFDIFFNFGMAFNGATHFVAVSVAWYLLYLFGIRLTFFRLSPIDEQAAL